MNQYFLKITKEERENILDKHKTLYDGYVTQYGTGNNQQPLYVQDFANDKDGITISNKGEVKKYTNMNINEDIDRRDKIADGKNDLKNGTVDMEDVEDDNFISLGRSFDEPYDEYEDEEECHQCGKNIEIELELDEGFDDFKIRDTRDSIDYDPSEFSKEYRVDMSTFDMDDRHPNYRKKYSDDEEDEDEDGDYNDLDLDFETIDEEILPEFIESLHESLDMFRRFKKYN
jgi:hypothetical protein